MIQEDFGMTQLIGEDPEGVWMRLPGKGCWESWSEEPHPRDGRNWKGNSSYKQNLTGVDMAHEHNGLKASAQRISSILFSVKSLKACSVMNFPSRMMVTLSTICCSSSRR